MSYNVVGLSQVGVQLSSRDTAVAPESAEKYFLCDKHFMADVEQLKALRSFMIRQAKTTTDSWKMELGALNLFRFDKRGRFPGSAAQEDGSGAKGQSWCAAIIARSGGKLLGLLIRGERRA